jgi:hypothetical protein
MYKGKRLEKSHRKSGRTIALLASLLLLICVTIGGTFAFLMDTTGPLQNLFNPAKVTTEVAETRSGTTKSNVYITNTGDTEAWIRAAVVITWQNYKGEVYGQKPVTNPECNHENCGCDYKITWGSGWLEGKDGFYYCTSPVAANGGKTGDLIDHCTYKANAPDGYSLTVEIIGSGIQSEPERVFNDEWKSSGLKVQKNNDGKSLVSASQGGT